MTDETRPLIRSLISCHEMYIMVLYVIQYKTLPQQAISAHEGALCQRTVCFEFQSTSDR